MKIKKKFISLLMAVSMAVSMISMIPTGAIPIGDVDDPSTDKEIYTIHDGVVDIILSGKEFVHTNKEIKPKVTFKYKSSPDKWITLKEGTDYTVDYYNNKEVGIGTVTVTGISDFNHHEAKDYYMGSVSRYFKINHDYDDGKVTVEPTSETLGEKTYTCKVCGDTYTQKIGKTGHNYKSVVTKEPTCTEEGIETFTCADCGDEYTETIKKADHEYATTWKTIKNPSCTVEGTKCHVCKICGEQKDFAPVPKSSHSYGKAEIIKDATCSEAGKKQYKCIYCKHIKTADIPKLEHKYETIVVKPTYLEQGYTNHICSVCGYSYNSNYTSKLSLGNVSGLKAASVTSNSVKLTWNKVTNADGYIVYRYDSAKKKWVRVAKGKYNGTYTVSKLSAAKEYKYTVKAYKTVSGKEITSPSYSTLTITTALTKVTNIKSTSTTKSVNLTWSKVAGAKGYYVYKHNGKTWVKIATVSANKYNVSKLSAGTSYKFTVKAYGTVNKKTITSDSYSTYQTSTIPANVSFKLTAGDRKATVKWSKVTGASGYKIYYKTSSKGKWVGLKTVNNKTTSYTKTGLKNGKAYWFTVKAYKNYNGKTYNAGYTTKSVAPKAPTSKKK